MTTSNSLNLQLFRLPGMSSLPFLPTLLLCSIAIAYSQISDGLGGNAEQEAADAFIGMNNLTSRYQARPYAMLSKPHSREETCLRSHLKNTTLCVSWRRLFKMPRLNFSIQSLTYLARTVPLVSTHFFSTELNACADLRWNSSGKEFAVGKTKNRVLFATVSNKYVARCQWCLRSKPSSFAGASGRAANKGG